MDYAIAIPSYNRPASIVIKTLSTLQKYKIPSSIITVFVASESQKVLYAQSIPEHSIHEIVVARPGLAEARNFITDYYPEGTKLVMLDDDVTDFVERTEDGRLRELISLSDVINTGFKEAEKTGARLWGVYPVPNGFFMKPTITSDLKFIIGSFFGVINTRMTLPMSEKEDYIRTLMCYERDGSVVRINYVSPKTAYYKEPGGMQSNPYRLENQKIAVKYLEETWPQYVRLNPRRKSKYPEILLRRVKAKKTVPS